MASSLLNSSVTRVSQWLASPLRPRQYLELLNPLWAEQSCGRIEKIQRETDNAVTLVIRPNHRWQGAVSGQYVRLGVDVDGVRHWRCYSVNSAQRPGDETFSVTVGRVNGGRVSTYIQDTLRVGDVIALDKAMGDFVLPTDATAKLLFISAGTGITPMMSMLRSLRDSGIAADVTHLHFAPTEKDCIYFNELNDFARRPGFNLHQSLTREGGQHFDAALLDNVCPDWAERKAYVCGPEGLMNAVRTHWQNNELSSQLCEEVFQPVRAEVPAGAGGTVLFWNAGSSTEGAGDKPLLEVAEDAGLLPKHGCRMGICQECVVTLREGQVRDLATGEVFGESGETIRICVCAAAGNVTIDL